MSSYQSSVFGRSSVAHQYDRALLDWQHSGNVARMAMACNIRHDHRVSREREDQFDDFCRQPRSANDLEQAISNYFLTKVRTRRYPHFVYNEINGCNLISGHPKLAQLLHKDRMLLRLIDLNGLVVPYRSLLDKRFRRQSWTTAFEAYYKIPRNLLKEEEQSWVDAWLTGILDHGNDGRRREFVVAVLALLRKLHDASAFQPTWATTLDAFEPHALTPDGKPNPDRWVQVMGMGRNPPRHWYIALAYTVAEAGTLARPTQLDGGWYEYHFPSPDSTPPEFGGFAMDLRLTPASSVLLPEYIHKEIGHNENHWYNAGALLGRSSDWRSSNLTETRRMHQRHLSLAYRSVTYRTCPNRNLCKIC
jgi:hypothetical protein